MLQCMSSFEQDKSWDKFRTGEKSDWDNIAA